MAGSIRLTKEESQQFIKLMSFVQLSDIFVVSEKFRNFGRGTGKNFKVLLDIKGTKIDMDSAQPEAYITYVIKLFEGRKKIFEQETTYRISLDITDKDQVKEILSNEKIRRFFLGKQLMKVTWPFLRQEFHDNCARVGIRPLTLPFLK